MTTMESKTDLQNSVEKLKALVNVGDVCMFTTLDNGSKITTRPMTTAGIDDDANLWFFTNEFSETIHEVSGDSLVHLMYANPSKNKYVHVRGNCVVVINREKAKELWSPFMAAWFPQGLDDPKLCLVKVMTGEADFWNNSSSKVVVGFNILKAMVTHSKYDEGEKGKLTLN